jgi:hypothetical protein
MYNVGKEIKLSYLITNLGIFTSYEIETNKYILNNIFLETTPLTARPIASYNEKETFFLNALLIVLFKLISAVTLEKL